MVTVEDDAAVGDVAAVEAFAGEPDAFGAEVAFAGPAGPGVVAFGIDALLGAGDVAAPVGITCAAADGLASGVLTADGVDGDGDGDDGADAAEGVDAAGAAETGTDGSASPAPAEDASDERSPDGAASTPVNDGLLASPVSVVSAAVGVVLCVTRASSRYPTPMTATTASAATRQRRIQ